MANAIQDENRVKTLVAVSYVDGVTLVPIKINASNGGLYTDTTNTFSGTINTEAIRDENHVKVLMAVNSDDGTTIPVYADPATGAILIGTS